jgi:hypothetical protein
VPIDIAQASPPKSKLKPARLKFLNCAGRILISRIWFANLGLVERNNLKRLLQAISCKEMDHHST